MFLIVDELTLFVTVLANFLILAVSRSSQSIALYICSIFTAICVRLNSENRLVLGFNGLGKVVVRVCLRGVPKSFSFIPLVGLRGELPRCFGLCVAYVMNSARDRKESAEGCTVRIVLNASTKYSNVSE